jgi:hypothetical protein
VQERATGSRAIIRCDAGEIYMVPVDEPKRRQRIYLRGPDGSERELTWVVIDGVDVRYKIRRPEPL